MMIQTSTLFAWVITLWLILDLIAPLVALGVMKWRGSRKAKKFLGPVLLQSLVTLSIVMVGWISAEAPWADLIVHWVWRWRVGSAVLFAVLFVLTYHWNRQPGKRASLVRYTAVGVIGLFHGILLLIILIPGFYSGWAFQFESRVLWGWV